MEQKVVLCTMNMMTRMCIIYHYNEAEYWLREAVAARVENDMSMGECRVVLHRRSHVSRRTLWRSSSTGRLLSQEAVHYDNPHYT